jgi:hypothetical protein
MIHHHANVIVNLLLVLQNIFVFNKTLHTTDPAIGQSMFMWFFKFVVVCIFFLQLRPNCANLLLLVYFCIANRDPTFMCKICSYHNIAEILLNLVLNTNQSINQDGEVLGFTKHVPSEDLDFHRYMLRYFCVQ